MRRTPHLIVALTGALLALVAVLSGCSLPTDPEPRASVDTDVQTIAYEDGTARAQFMTGCKTTSVSTTAKSAEATTKACSAIFACAEKHIPIDRLRLVIIGFTRFYNPMEDSGLSEEARVCITRAVSANAATVEGGYKNPLLREQFTQQCLSDTYSSGVAVDQTKLCKSAYACVRRTMPLKKFLAYSATVSEGGTPNPRLQKRLTRCVQRAYRDA